MGGLEGEYQCRMGRGAKMSLLHLVPNSNSFTNITSEGGAGENKVRRKLHRPTSSAQTPHCHAVQNETTFFLARHNKFKMSSQATGRIKERNN